jgi:hypothetical protein
MILHLPFIYERDSVAGLADAPATPQRLDSNQPEIQNVAGAGRTYDGEPRAVAGGRA